jgi:hypothetical protein
MQKQVKRRKKTRELKKEAVRLITEQAYGKDIKKRQSI